MTIGEMVANIIICTEIKDNKGEKFWGEEAEKLVESNKTDD